MKKKAEVEITEVLRNPGKTPASFELREIPKAPKVPHGHQGTVVWFTGLSCAGKTTVARALYKELHGRGDRVELLDADDIRPALWPDLGFSKEDRDENVRRLGFLAELLSRNGVTVLVTAISPYRAGRLAVRSRVSTFIEVYMNAPLQACEARDVKGLYRKMRAGEISGLSGVDYPYEVPENPEVECHSDVESVGDCVGKVLRAMNRALAAVV